MQSSGQSSVDVSTDYGSWYWFIFIVIVFGLLFYSILRFADIKEISTNWPKYRCSPAIMPFASMYGYNTSENFNYCIENIFKSQMSQATGPFGTILSTMILGMMEFAKNLNSLRVMMATLLGGITRIFQEFTDRFKTFMGQTQVTSLRIQMLMKRVFGVLFAVIYMGLSAITAGNNFLQTFIFKFIDTFCFAPETHINIKDKGQIHISEVVLGDILEDSGDVVTSVYRFMADGQTMVKLGPIEVSTNHYVQHNGHWIEAKNHPDAVKIDDWAGGPQRPLICLDTSTHRIPIGNYIFSDWDETTQTDETVMRLAEMKLNGIQSNPNAFYRWPLQSSLDGSILVKMADRTLKQVRHLTVGDKLSTGTVTGTGKRTVKHICILPSGLFVSPSQLLWCKDKWVRAGHLYPVQYHKRLLYTLVVMNSGIIESNTGRLFRDMLEVHSSDLEDPIKSTLLV